MTCRGCGAALAEDQRYCLNCGQRQGEARVDFRRHLGQAQTATKEPSPPANGRREASAVAPPDPPPPDRRQRDYAPLAAAAGIAVLGIMLLIGVLIGRGTGSEQTSSAPQVVTVAGGESAGSGDEVAKAGEGAGKAKQKGGKSGKKRKTVAGGSADTGNAPVASTQQLEQLQGKTGQEYAEESAKLPDEIATPGAPPPTDDKAPGGGTGGGVTIE